MAKILVNEAKVNRAIKTLKEEARQKGEEMSKFVPSDESITALYLKYGGLMIDEQGEVAVEGTTETPKKPRGRRVEVAE